MLRFHLFVLIGLLVATSGAEAQDDGQAIPATDERSVEEREAEAATAVALARALDERLTVWQAGDRRVYVRHCRSSRVDCRARLVAFARILTSAGYQHGVDPFLLAAMALRESGLNPFAEGSLGERGIVQLHPRGVGSRVRFVRSEGYRRRCERREDACQGEVVDEGAAHVASAIERCGTVEAGLGAYNSGVCQVTAYSERVLESRIELLRLAKADIRPDRALLD
jgi:hypothetical protein